MIMSHEVSQDPFKNTVIFLSNATLDGFREGDGDLMDKLTSSLNDHHQVHAIRIIQNDLNIPEDKKDLLEKKQLIFLSHTETKTIPDIPSLQAKVLEIVQNTEYQHKRKIFYIGSRLRAKIDSNGIKLGESGSLFDEAFIQKLKALDIKIVICALEYQFFRRSLVEMERCYQTLKQHFFQADKIHFLTKCDKKFFEDTLEALQIQPILKPLPLALEGYEAVKKRAEIKLAKVAQKGVTLLMEIEELKEELEANKKASEEILSSQPDKKKLTKNDKEKLGGIRGKRQEILNKLNKLENVNAIEIRKNNERQKEINEQLGLLEASYHRSKEFHFEDISSEQFALHKEKGVFISGIYTVDPLTPEEIKKLAPRVNLDPNLPFKEILFRRPCNILQFGMIRGEKGIDEAIALGLLFQEKGDDHKVIIAGKLMLDLNIVKVIFSRIFEMKPDDFKTRLGETLNLPTGRKLPRNTQDAQNLIEANGVISKFNAFCGKLYQELKKTYPERGKNIVIYFDVEEDKLRELAMQCKYAMKFDHKGMANNASTIASCLGFYLPTFTTCGLVTDEEFINVELEPDERSPEVPAKYHGATMMPNKEYSSENDMGEIKPKNPSIDRVYNFIKTDTKYAQRLEVLDKLYNEQVFNSKDVAGKLKEDILKPLLKEDLIQSSKKDTSIPMPLIEPTEMLTTSTSMHEHLKTEQQRPFPSDTTLEEDFMPFFPSPLHSLEKNTTNKDTSLPSLPSQKKDGTPF